MWDGRCPVCGSGEVVDAGTLTVSGARMQVTVEHASLCTLCGHLELAIPQPALVRLYPPGVRYLTRALRDQLRQRRRLRRRYSGLAT
ncbi:conserved protein of unknown function [Candidatus Hydrogenisulfobacillus filiaventi]|uniref:Uncharacterized protein n=1 Tax=Candidatus Hydrogenisulfobacillus filiaventi TaxID=2707344 RepID=A0A6F8ZH34_9FIRM|nr:conserved protein of unknown function [Candidatus Hydrogenisulfobacillus filiaventi]